MRITLVYCLKSIEWHFCLEFFFWFCIHQRDLLVCSFTLLVCVWTLSDFGIRQIHLVEYIWYQMYLKVSLLCFYFGEFGSLKNRLNSIKFGGKKVLVKPHIPDLSFGTFLFFFFDFSFHFHSCADRLRFSISYNFRI